VAPLIAKTRPEEWRALHAVADRLVPSLRRALLQAVERVRRSISVSDVAAALERGDVDALRRMGVWDDLDAELQRALRPVVEQGIVGGGQTAIGNFPPSVQAQIQFDLTNPLAIRAIDTQVAAIVRQLVNVDAEAILGILQQGFREGIPPRDMARRMRQYLGLTPQYANAVERYREGLLEQEVAPGRIDELAAAYSERLRRMRALTIARTETIRASNGGQQAAWQQAEQQKLLDRTRTVRRFIVTPDDRLCPICEAVPEDNPDGVGLDQPFRTQLGYVMHPPVHPNCLPGDALVAARDRVTAQSERWYEGELVIIRTARGQELAITPNHPVLTDRGWMPAGALHERDNLVCDLAFEGKAGAHDDYELMPTAIKQVARALWESGQMATREVPLAPEDFHGDGIGAEVAIVRSDRLLRNRWQARSGEPLTHLTLAWRLPSHARHTFGTATRPLPRTRLTPQGRMGSAHLMSPLAGAHLGPLEQLGLAAAAWGDARFDQPESDRPTTDPECIRERLFGATGQILLDEVVNVDRQAFHGPVHTLETESGWYIAGGFIVKNCRCAIGLEFAT
jgi:hypothetical protein